MSTAPVRLTFALLGDHPDGLYVTCALALRGHRLGVYWGPDPGHDFLRRRGFEPTRTNDLEEILADPAIELLIVAGPAGKRADILRRALQSERHVLCVHPVDGKPDAAFEAALNQAASRQLLLPLLPEAFHPGVERFRQLREFLPGPTVLEFERWATETYLIDADTDNPGLPGWDVLRRVGGEILEIFAQATGEELSPGRPLLMSGRFVDGRMVRMLYMPEQLRPRWRLSIGGTRPMSLEFAEGWPGAAVLEWIDEAGQARSESWAGHAPWTPIAEMVERLLLGRPPETGITAPRAAVSARRMPAPADPGTALVEGDDASWTSPAPRLGWTDAIRAIELDDAVRRSLRYRRAYQMDLQDASEEGNFKGTMTLVGCSMLWLAIGLLFASIWMPQLGYVIFPALGIFLVLQALRWVVPRRGGPDKPAKM
jgi:Oxidoreductase family, NAD-binding Rossmann fold